MVASGVGLAVPSNAVSRRVRYGSSRAALGVTARPVPITLRGKEQIGFVILEIHNDSAAKDASLMLGDIITAVDGRPLDSTDDFEQALDGADERIVRLQLLRGDRVNARSVGVRLGAPKLAAA
jgi:S1-C subfamily serine protease